MLTVVNECACIERMTRWGWVVIAFTTISGACGCATGTTTSRECRRANKLTTLGDPVMGILESSHCDDLEARERRSEVAKARSLAKLDDIRRAPRAPELGAPIAEAEAICTQQRGRFVMKADAMACRIGGPVVFVGVVGGDGRVSRIDTYYEGADIGEGRRNVEKTLGPFEREEVTPEGYRAFFWKGGSVALTMYPRGLRWTKLAAPAATTTSR